MARKFNATVDLIDAGTEAAFKIIGDITWAGWVKFTTLTDVTDFMMVIEGGTGELESDNTTIVILTAGSSGFWDIRYTHEYSTGSNEDHTYNTNYPNNTWIHIAVVRDTTAKNVKLYSGGSLFATFNYTNNPTSTGASMYYRLGGRGSEILPFEGSIAYACLADVAWSIAEVNQAMNRGVSYRGLVAYHPLGYGDPEPDLSGNEHSGTVTGTTIDSDNPPVASIFGLDNYILPNVVPVVGDYWFPVDRRIRNNTLLRI